MSFLDVDLREDVLYPHDDPLVISVPINQALVKRTLVDTDLITLDALQKIGVDSSLIRPVKSPLTGFSQVEKIQLEGVVTLTLRLETLSQTPPEAALGG